MSAVVDWGLFWAWVAIAAIVCASATIVLILDAFGRWPFTRRSR